MSERVEAASGHIEDTPAIERAFAPFAPVDERVTPQPLEPSPDGRLRILGKDGTIKHIWVQSSQVETVSLPPDQSEGAA